MSLPAPDDLAGGPARDPIPAPRWLHTAAFVAVALLALWILVTKDDSPTKAARPPESSPAVIAPTQRAVVLGSQPGLLGVRAVCVRTDATGPWLGIDLVNGRLARTTLLGVTPAAGADGSTASDPVLPARRTCDRRPTARHSLVMLPNGVVPLRLRLHLPDGCPAAPISVQVDVSFLGPGEQPDTQHFSLHPDPSEVDIPACRGTG